MGKLIFFVSILVFAELLFLSTGQLCATGTCSLSSIIFNALLNLQDFNATELFTELIGAVGSLFSSSTGIASLLVTGAVLLGSTLFRTSDTLLFIVMAFTLALLAGDFVFMFVYLASINFLLATFVMAPLMIIYIFTVLDWVKNKD